MWWRVSAVALGVAVDAAIGLVAYHLIEITSGFTMFVWVFPHMIVAFILFVALLSWMWERGER